MDTLEQVKKPVREQRRAYHVRLRPSVFAVVQITAEAQDSTIGKVMEDCIKASLMDDGAPERSRCLRAATGRQSLALPGVDVAGGAEETT